MSTCPPVEGGGYTGIVDSADIRRWVADKRASEVRERTSAIDAWGSPEQTVRDALALVRLYGELHGWPAPEDEVTAREDQEGWARFARLRAALAHP
jgi:hypothetical protein